MPLGRSIRSAQDRCFPGDFSLVVTGTIESGILSVGLGDLVPNRRKENAIMLMDGGMSIPAEGVEESKFFTGIIISPNYCKDAVPELQDLKQVDGCHI